MELGLVRSIDLNEQMQQAYLDYAMSVIVARALPDARDGLKPVHRRILYGMYDMGLRPNSATKKSARIVGEVMGKYHPHGDLPVYDAMARMAQDFSMRYLLVEGQGNFGSVDGDPPAAMRYTEARLAAPSMHLLADIDKNTVDFGDNFDGSLQEPQVLPAAIPNLLVNGATGIAVGMSTNIPPHNLSEVVDALRYMLANWEKLDEVNIEDLMKFIKGPDFPTGGIILEKTQEEGGLSSAYGTGRGRVIVQARWHKEEMDRGRSRIIVTELPYQVNKANLIERIADLVRDGRLEGISDLRDESDRQGLRIVIELTRTADPDKVIGDLYKSTQMRDTFNIILLALVDGEPRMLSLKQALRVYLDHRLVVIRRRAEYELEKARQRAHILEGYLIALKNLDAVIDLIRKSPDADTAKTRLIKRFKLSEIQAQAILDMQLRRLAALERKKIEEEYKALQRRIKELVALLKSPKKMREMCATELTQVKELYGDRRRTFIAGASAASSPGQAMSAIGALTPDHTLWVSVTADGLISRSIEDKSPRISGTAAPKFLLRTNSQDVLYLVAENGEAASLPVHALPETESPAEGNPYHQVASLDENIPLAVLFTLPPKEKRAEGHYIFTCTRQGMVKKTDITEAPGPTAHAFTLVKVNEEDALGWLRLTDGKANILLATADGMAIRFSEDDVRPMGLVAAGVGGIKLGPRDEIVGMEVLSPKNEVLLVASDGRGKRCTATLFPTQGRYGMGVVAWKLPRGTNLVGLAVGRPSTRVTLLLTKLAPKALRLDAAPLQTRAAGGKSVVGAKNVEVVGVTIPWNVPRLGEAETPEPDSNADDDDEPSGSDGGQQLTLDLGATSAASVKKAPVRKRARSTGRSKSASASPATSRNSRGSRSKTKATEKTTPTARRTRTATTSAKPAKTTRTKPVASKPETAEAKTTQPKTTSRRKTTPALSKANSSGNSPAASSNRTTSRRKTTAAPGESKSRSKSPTGSSNSTASRRKSPAAPSESSPRSKSPAASSNGTTSRRKTPAAPGESKSRSKSPTASSNRTTSRRKSPATPSESRSKSPAASRSRTTSRRKSPATQSETSTTPETKSSARKTGRRSAPKK